MELYCSHLSCVKKAVGGYRYLTRTSDYKAQGSQSDEYRWICWCKEHEDGQLRLAEGKEGRFYNLARGESPASEQSF